MTVRSSAFGRRVFATSLLLLTVAAPAWAATVFTGGNGVVVFGVAPYGGGPVAGPSFIANNFTGLNDILSSPGVGTLGGYQTASPVIANNIFSLGPLGLPVGGFQIGGGNGNGPFGAGAIVNTGPLIGVSLADSGPGGGSASYAITSEIAKWTNVGAVVPMGASYGAFIAMGGFVPLVGNADVLALKVSITDTGGAFGGGVTLPNLILAISRNGTGSGIGNYNIITVGGAGGGNAGLILDNGVIGAFRAGAVDNQLTTAPIPVGDVITVTATLTAYADPASFSTFDLSLQPDLLNLTGPLAATDFVGTASVPEPASIVLCGLGVLGVLGCSVRQWRKQAGLKP